ncbi:hypothetical protein EYF80_048935 [Liparis tanakae]|uniref:Uncharacterized protein n=1 Tax=Liparis tanakae TaxID=230148 RepID=A0A4Z2FIW3_9TELE|nr:hypothetical protein EYF80_048935 [Liparis tanakae]
MDKPLLSGPGPLKSRPPHPLQSGPIPSIELPLLSGPSPLKSGTPGTLLSGPGPSIDLVLGPSSLKSGLGTGPSIAGPLLSGPGPTISGPLFSGHVHSYLVLDPLQLNIYFQVRVL